MNFVLYKTSIDVEIAYLFISFSEFLQKAMNNYYCRSYETTEVWDHCWNSLWGPQSAKAAFVQIYLYVWMWLLNLIAILVWFWLVQISLWNCWKGFLVKKIHVVQVPYLNEYEFCRWINYRFSLSKTMLAILNWIFSF